jgi:hypothetical protein
VSLGIGDYVQVAGHHAPRNPHFQNVRRNTRGTVRRIEGDWAQVELPNGGRFDSLVGNLTRLVRAEEGGL